jgi:hypothetical protein
MFGTVTDEVAQVGHGANPDEPAKPVTDVDRRSETQLSPGRETDTTSRRPVLHDDSGPWVSWT